MTDKRYTAEDFAESARLLDRAGYKEFAKEMRQAAKDCEDAERYRWLRDSNADNIQNGGIHLEVFADNGYEGRWVGSDLDDVVDTARTQEKANG